MTKKESIRVMINYNSFITTELKRNEKIKTKKQVLSGLDGSLDGLLECLEKAED